MKKERLTCERARKIPIEKALEFLGHLPTRSSEKEAWFLSPLRSETQASFKVSKKLNRWYDHGLGIGGNIIDLICELSKVSVSQALEILARLKTVNHNVLPQPQIHFKESNIGVKQVKIIQHPALLEYLRERKISLIAAKRFCREVHYTIGDKTYFSIGLKNNSGGWELRNRYCKSSSSPKDIKWIKNGSQTLLVLEGMFDLLSLTTLYPSLKRKADFLILNSIAFVEKAIPVCENYESIELYLDRDEAGRKTTAFFLNENSRCSDKSDFYKAHKDLNAWLMKKE